MDTYLAVVVAQRCDCVYTFIFYSVKNANVRVMKMFHGTIILFDIHNI